MTRSSQIQRGDSAIPHPGRRQRQVPRLLRFPLGAEPVWAAFGRLVVASLTTQSSSVRGFPTLLLARWFGEHLASAGGVPREAALDVFLRTEQIGAYVRRVAHGIDEAIRGIARVRALLDETGGRPVIDVRRRGRILSDQRVHGLWGIYSVPARRSGWLIDGPVRLTERARGFAEEDGIRPLGRKVAALEKLLIEGGELRTGRGGDEVFRLLVEPLRPEFSSAERDFYGRDLRDGVGVPGGRLRQVLRRELEAADRFDPDFDRADEFLVERASATAPELAERLRRIARIEALLAPADALFDLGLARGGRSVTAGAAEAEAPWAGPVPHLGRMPFDALAAEVEHATGSPEPRHAMADCDAALAAGDYVTAIRALVRWSARVMAERGSAPWVAIGRDDILDVRYRGLERPLPTREELDRLWANSYFVDAFKTVTKELRG